MKSIFLVVGLLVAAYIVFRVFGVSYLKKISRRRATIARNSEISRLESELGEQVEKAQELAGELINKAKIKRLSELYLDDLDLLKRKR